MSDARAVRYRRLAMAEQDPERGRVLHQIADEAERGMLGISVPRSTTAAQSPPVMPAT